MTARICDTCTFWIEEDNYGAVGSMRSGQCRRFPPPVSHQWPRTSPSAFCGEYAADEKKVAEFKQKTFPSSGSHRIG